ncbi:MAG: hypothetical protein L0Y71_00960 [Gemmataceae bacterium]|nr:hypothetical protein [Gemmataceae bacterium]
MTVRERNFLIVLVVGVAVVMGGGILTYQWLLAPLHEAKVKIAGLEDEVWQKQQLISAVRHDQKKLAKYKALSLPNNLDQAQSDYFEYLQMLLRGAGLTVHVQGPAGALKAPVAQGKKAGHVTLPFMVSALGDKAGVVKALAALRAAPIAHRIKSLTLAPADAAGSNAGKLKIQMGIEALVVHKANSLQPYISAPDTRLAAVESLTAYLRAPGGLAIGSWAVARVAVKNAVATEELLARNYSDIPNRNVFTGPLPPPVVEEDTPVDDLDVLAHTYLVQTSPTVDEAFLRIYIYRAPEIRVRPKSGGYQIFRIFNEDRDLVVVRGKALRVDQRDLYFQVGEDIYAVHLGQSLKQAMRWPLSTDRIEELALTDLYDEEFAEASATTETAAPAKKKFGPLKKTPTKGKFPRGK